MASTSGASRRARRYATACQCPDADIFFLVGGTQANATVIDGVLPAYEGGDCRGHCHINVHESGAVEANGHKVITLPSHEGKMLASDLETISTASMPTPSMSTWSYPALSISPSPPNSARFIKAPKR